MAFKKEKGIEKKKGIPKLFRLGVFFCLFVCCWVFLRKKKAGGESKDFKRPHERGYNLGTQNSHCKIMTVQDLKKKAGGEEAK